MDANAVAASSSSLAESSGDGGSAAAKSRERTRRSPSAELPCDGDIVKQVAAAAEAAMLLLKDATESPCVRYRRLAHEIEGGFITWMKDAQGCRELSLSECGLLRMLAVVLETIQLDLLSEAIESGIVASRYMSLRAALADHVEQPRAHNEAPADVLEIWKRLEGVFFVEAESKPQYSEASRSCANAAPDCALSGACVRLPRACVPGASTPAQLRWLCKLLGNILHTDFERTGYSYTNRSGVLKEFLEVAAASGQESCFICLEAFEVLPDSQCRAMTCRELPIAAQCGHCTHVGCLVKAATVAAPPPGETGQPEYEARCRKCRTRFFWTQQTGAHLVATILDELAAMYFRKGTTGSRAPTVDDAADISRALWSRLTGISAFYGAEDRVIWIVEVDRFLAFLACQAGQSKEAYHPVPLGFRERLAQELEDIERAAESESESDSLGAGSLHSDRSYEDSGLPSDSGLSSDSFRF